jgi:3D (Asp-Asp-Asp) domain-containing protein
MGRMFLERDNPIKISMNYRNIFIMLLVICMVLLIGNIASAQELQNKNDDSMSKKPLFEGMYYSIRFEKEGDALKKEGIHLYTQEEKTQIAYEKRMSYWKEKQKQYWEALPNGKFEINASAYTASADECGKSDGITASGIKVGESRTLACPPQYPFGAKIYIQGMGIYTCEDRGGAITGNKFDIYMETKQEALSFGRRNVIASVLE